MENESTALFNERTQSSELTVKCAWHPKYFGEEKVMHQGTSKDISHGICSDCQEILAAKLPKRAS